MGLLTTLFGVMAVATVGAAGAAIVNYFSNRAWIPEIRNVPFDHS